MSGEELGEGMSQDSEANFEIREEPVGNLEAYAEIPIAFLVDSVLLPVEPPQGAMGLRFDEAPQAPPYWKDYDADRGNHPTDWAKRFDTSSWVLISAWHESVRIGGIVVAHACEGVDMLEGREDLAVLWDVRIAPEFRRRGVGAALFAVVEAWAQARGCRSLKVETQNINVGACKFYEGRGFELGRVDPLAYPELPNETQMLWYKDI